MRYIFITIILIFSNAIFAKENPLVKTENLSTTSSLPSNSENLTNQSIIELKAQNNLIKDYHDTLIDTVYWTIGSVFAILIVLISYSGFTSFRINQQKLNEIREELQNTVKSNVLENKKYSTELISQFSEKLKSQNDIVLEKVDKAIENQKSLLFQIIEKPEKNIESLEKEIESLTKLSLRNKTGLDSLETHLRMVEESIWEIKKIPTNILLTQAQGIVSAIKSEDNNLVSLVARRIKSTLETYYNSDQYSVSEFTYKTLVSAIESAEKIDPILISQIKTLLTKVKIDKD